VTLRVLADAEAVSRAGAELFEKLASDAIAARGVFRVALSGGSTPKRMFELLAAEPFRSRIEWPRVSVWFGDERAVPPDHADSNYHTAEVALLSRVPLARENAHRMCGEAADLDRAAADYAAEIAREFGVAVDGPPPAFDLIYLGLGDDAHTASLFPGTAALDETRRWVVANPVPDKHTTRLTFSAPLINAAREVAFLVAGASKAAAMRAVSSGPRDARRFPAQLVDSPVGRLLWLVDAAANGG
jgi:6-phosphogluconolactonase